MNITKIIEFLNHRSGSTEITINRYSRISIEKFSSYPEAEKAHHTSVSQFQKIIRQWEMFQKLDMDERAKIIDDLENLKVGKKALTAGKIRQVYRQVIEGNYSTFDPLSKIKWVGYNGSLQDRIVIEKKPDDVDVKIENVWFETWRSVKLEENKESIKLYRAELDKKWGIQRVNRALARCQIDFDKMIKEGTALRLLDTRLITMSLIDMHNCDVQGTYDRILDFTYGSGTLAEI
ncbi:MAG: hypothetical protein K940chlam3_01016, partial [Chlamydiae bacterium]|nr:hypothetical protein [Chlamydiota bacterium]